MRKRLLCLMALLTVLALLAGCAGAATQPTPTPAPLTARYPVTVTDSLGRQVTLEAEPQVIVSLTPANTEILFALGVGDRVAGVDAVSDYPEQVAALPKVGDYSGPSVEAIVGLAPDLILAGNNIQGEAVTQLESLGLTVVAIEAYTWEEIPRTITTVGDLVGRPQAAADLNAQMAADQQAVADALKDAQPVNAYFVMCYGESGNWTTGPGTFVDTLITMAGGASISADAPANWLEYNMEDIVVADPYAFLLADDFCVKEDFVALDGFKDMTAVREGRVYMINADTASRPGPRITQALLEFARALHPECFE